MFYKANTKRSAMLLSANSNFEWLINYEPSKLSALWAGQEEIMIKLNFILFTFNSWIG